MFHVLVTDSVQPRCARSMGAQRRAHARRRWSTGRSSDGRWTQRLIGARGRFARALSVFQTSTEYTEKCANCVRFEAKIAKFSRLRLRPARPSAHSKKSLKTPHPYWLALTVAGANGNLNCARRAPAPFPLPATPHAARRACASPSARQRSLRLARPRLSPTPRLLLRS